MGGSSGWWKHVTSIVEKSDNRWFWEKVKLKLGDGGLSPFWNGLWAGDKTLKERFPRLYCLCSKKDGMVRDMGEWVEGKWSWKVDWRRDLGRVDEFHNFLNRFSLTVGAADHWCWGDDEKGVFSVNVAYKELIGRNSHLQLNRPCSVSLRCVWKAWATLKGQGRGVEDTLESFANER